jgi:hypothetical protein
MGPYLRRVCRAFADRIIPPGGDIGLGVEETRCVSFVEGYLRDLPPGTARALEALLAGLDHMPPVLLLRLKRFVNLTVEQQDQFLRGWQDSPIYWRRMVLVLLKMVFGLGYYGDPRVAARIGWEDKCERGRAPRPSGEGVAP